MGKRPRHRSSPDCRAAAAELVVACVGGVADAEALGLLHQARAWHSHALFDLHDHLATHPDAFTSGSSAVPQSLLRLIWALIDAGHHDVVAPRCAGCGRQARDLPMVQDAGRCCVPCYRKATKTSCARCGRSTKNAYRRAEGIVCPSCRDAEPASRGSCEVCGWHAPLRRAANGVRRCDRCVPKPLRTCVGCGVSAPARKITDAGPLCGSCHQKVTARQCGGCGRVRPIVRVATATTPDLCLTCRPRTRGVCAGCGRQTTGNRTDRGRGDFLCQPCQPKINQQCALCQKLQPACALWPIGPVCRTCYEHAKRHPGTCAACHEVAVLIGENDHSDRLCGRCAGADNDYRCTRCGAGTTLFSHGLCDKCVLNDEISRLLHAAHDPAQLAPLAQALRGSRSATGTVRWLRQQPAGQLLTSLITEGQALSHALLDQLPQRQHVHKLRHILVRAGVLPDRNEYLDRIPAWLTELLQQRPAAHRELVQPYVRWSLLHRARRRAAKRTITPSAAHGMRSHVRAILAFLAWLDSRDRTMATTTQHDLDTWLDKAPTSHYRVRQFIAWAQQRNAAPPELAIPAEPKSPTNPRILDDSELCQQLRTCLHDNTLPLDVRVAGSIMLLLGIRCGALVQLTVDHVIQHDNQVHLIAGRAPLKIPPPLDTLLTRLAAQPADPAPLSQAVGPSHYLFPGAAPGRPIRTQGMRNRLNRHGITAEPGRRTALRSLTADLPAPVVADLLGIRVSTALRWAEHTAPDWAAYIDARTHTKCE